MYKTCNTFCKECAQYHMSQDHHTGDLPCRLLRLKRRHRDITDTLIVLVPRLISVAILLVVVYYFFSIIGIETLNGVVTEGCW